jgi:predicted nucleotidyltransferase
MNKNRNEFKLLVRRFVLATSFPPFLQMYRFFYKIVTRMALRIFKKYPEIEAVYLTRGGAKKEILPLISDIDFVIIGKRMDGEDIKELHHAYENLARATTLLDRNIEVFDEGTFYKNYEINDYFQYRFIEGRKTWKLLYGKDYLVYLQELPVEKMYGGFYTEIKVWWTHFAWRFFQERKYDKEILTRNNVCYKTVSEILKMSLALNHGILEFDRREALRKSKPQFNGKERVLLDKLENTAQKRFRINDEGILNETKDFVINYLNRFYGEFQNHPYARSLKDITQKVECPKDEWLLNEKDRAHIMSLVRFIKERWSRTYRGAYLVPSAYFNMDEFLLMIEVNPKQLPTVQELTELNLFRWNAEPELKSRIKLFLLLPNAAFQIDPDDFKKSWQSILCPPCNPDLFELLSRSEFTLDGGSYQPATGSVWTPLVEHFFWEEKMLFYELLENPSIYKLNSLDFLRIFWKTVQLVLMNRSVKSDEILYPLTLPAIERALANKGIPLPDQLKNLTNAYRNELDGKTIDIASLIQPAIRYLKEINS